MGFDVSWIGFHRATKDEILRKAGLQDTGEHDPTNGAPFSGAEIPGGWFNLFSNDFLYASLERVAALSADCRAVTCQVHEGVM